MKNSPRSGFTFFELLFCLFALAQLTLVIGVIYVACHFIAKYWN